jgi:hypothetical protein
MEVKSSPVAGFGPVRRFSCIFPGAAWYNRVVRAEYKFMRLFSLSLEGHMARITLRPMGVGQMLDRSFQVYRELFSPLFLITLIAFGPFFLLSNVLVVNLGALPLVPEFRFDDADRFWFSRFPDTWLEGGLDLWIKIVGMLLLVLVLIFLIIPLYMAMAVIMTNKALNGEPVLLADALNEAWRKYGRVLGNSMLFYLISIGAYMGVMMVNGILSMVYGGVVLSAAAIGGSEALEAVAGMSFLILYILFAYGGTLAYYYFMIRFGYFLPPILFENEGVAVGRSWSLTRRAFWRLFAVYILLAVLTYVFAIALALVFAALGVSIAGLLLALVVMCALIPVGLVTYTLTYKVQKVRNDAEDIEELLQRIRGPVAEPVAEPEAAPDGEKV